MVNKRVRNAVLRCNLRNDRMISVHLQGKPFNITVIQIYTPTTDAEEAEVDQFYEDLQDPPELTPEKRCPFHHRRLECKRGTSGDTCSNRQIWAWSTKWSRAKSNRVLPREHTGHSKHPLPAKQKMTTHGHHQKVSIKIRLIIFFAAKDGEASYTLRKTIPGADYGSDHNSLLPSSDLNWRSRENH